MSAREDDIVASFVSMAGSLAQGHDVNELLTQLAADCARCSMSALSGCCSPTLAARCTSWPLRPSASHTSRPSRPSANKARATPCYLDGQPVNVPDLAAAAARWPDFAAVAAKAGVASVHAVPMRLRDAVVGALNLFGATPGSLKDSDLRLAQALADVATISLIQDRAAVDRTLVNEQLQNALDSRVILEQAKGVLSHSGDLDMPAAYAALRTYARDHNIKLTELSRALVNRAVPAALVVDHARTRDARAV